MLVLDCGQHEYFEPEEGIVVLTVLRNWRSMRIQEFSKHKLRFIKEIWKTKSILMKWNWKYSGSSYLVANNFFWGENGFEREDFPDVLCHFFYSFMFLASLVTFNFCPSFCEVKESLFCCGVWGGMKQNWCFHGFFLLSPVPMTRSFGNCLCQIFLSSFYPLSICLRHFLLQWNGLCHNSMNSLNPN